MSEQANEHPEEGMVEKILDDARSQAERAIKNAERSVESERRKAQAQAEKARQEILERMGRKADALKAKEIATAQIESKRVLLKAREEAIARVLAAIETELMKTRENPGGYAKTMRRLAVEAVAAIDQPKAILRIAPGDQAVTGGDFAGDVMKGVRAATGKEVEIKIEVDSGLPAGGCVAASEDGRIIFDSTFRRRLERMKPELRSMIVREVLASDG
jgi:vacuolar-type H+-ATPase subunit E/Vma4